MPVTLVHIPSGREMSLLEVDARPFFSLLKEDRRKAAAGTARCQRRPTTATFQEQVKAKEWTQSMYRSNANLTEATQPHMLPNITSPYGVISVKPYIG